MQNIAFENQILPQITNESQNIGSVRYEEFENIAHVYIEDKISQVCDATAWR